MATRYGRGTADDKVEYFDDASRLEDNVALLSRWISDARHCIVFTGAGISTSTGIPDFRSGMDTVLDTGPGAWELRDAGQQRKTTARVKSTLQAIPSATHMALVELQRRGKVKFVVSQNCDGLHLRSGLHPDCLAELHGNTNLEICEQCHRKYLRDFSTRNAKHVHEHFTGRHCDDVKCRGKLNDSIINFGENLPTKELRDAFRHADRADLCLCLGSSLTVSPANDIPRRVAEKGNKLAIVNLQKTPLHDAASLSLHGMCDDVMRGVMAKLDIPIPTWRLRRTVAWELSASYVARGQTCIEASVSSRHPDCDVPYLIFKSVTMVVVGGGGLQQTTDRSPHRFKLMLADQPASEVAFTLHFFGHYDEPPYQFSETVPSNGTRLAKEAVLLYCPFEGKWSVESTAK